MDSVTQFNGTTTDYDYDQADRLTGIRHETAAGLLVDYDYQLDANGNRAIVTIDNEPILPTQLIDATQSQTYNPTKNRLTSATIDGQPIAFSYDNEGQLQTKGNTTFTFDAAHRLTGYADKQFFYDGVGNRIKAIRNGVTSQYVYDAAGNLLVEADQSDAIKRYYIHGLGLMAMVDAQTNQLYVYHFDGTGHTVAMTDADQAIVNRYAYDPYSRVLGKDETVVQPFTYVGQAGVMTEADGLYYMRARYYDAEVGRFISEDPIGFDGGINLYAYVGGNPIMLVDPNGEFANFIAGGVWGSVSGGIGGLIASGGDWESGLKGALVGAAVGAVNPFGSYLAGAAAGNVVAGVAGQAVGIVETGGDLLDASKYDGGAIVGSAFIGVGGAQFGRYLATRNTLIGSRLGRPNKAAIDAAEAVLGGSGSGIGELLGRNRRSTYTASNTQPGK